MVNRLKVINEIKNDGKYDAILDYAKKELACDEPTLEQITELVDNNPYYINEYKDLNRWGELSSIHIHNLALKNNDTLEAKNIKDNINKNIIYLQNAEEYQVPSKNSIYLAWACFIALPSIYVIDNIVRLFTDLYIDGNEISVYLSFIIVLLLSTWGYVKVKKNHENQHKRYLQTQVVTRELIESGLKKEYFTFEEVYQD